MRPGEGPGYAAKSGPRSVACQPSLLAEEDPWDGWQDGRAACDSFRFARNLWDANVEEVRQNIALIV
eukprot:3774180-Pyramimonas_sp.AAC.1